MPNFKKSPAGGPIKMKMYGQGKNPIMMSEAQRTKLPSKVVDAIDKKEKDSGILMYDKGSMAKMYDKKSPAKKYAPGQAAAIYAQKADDAKKKKRK